MNHTKPTTEEMEAEMKKTEETIAALDNGTIEEKAEETAPTDETTTEETTDNSTTTDDTQETEDPEPSQEDVDYKKKFTESTREAQILHAKNKQINEAIAKANELPEITEEELQAEYTDWDVMSDTEKKLAKNSMKNDRRFALIDQVTKDSKDIEAWNIKVDTFITDPKILIDNPKLEGKEEEFKLFATKNTRRGVDFEVLVSSFLYTAENSKVKNKGKMFEQGTSGNKNVDKPKNDKVAVEQSRVMSKDNYKDFKAKLIAGKIATEV